jgi:hypothetical protein
MYTLEVEVGLDSGRPICIRNSDIDVDWPLEVDDDVLIARITLMIGCCGRSNCDDHSKRAMQNLISHSPIAILAHRAPSYEDSTSPGERANSSYIQSKRRGLPSLK